MKETVLSQSEIVMELDDTEQFHQEVLSNTISRVVSGNALLRSIFLVISPETATEHDLFLRERGWTFVGVVSAHKTYWKLRVRTGIQSSEANVSQLAVDEQILPRADYEVAACELVRQKYGPRS